jgi:predicted alpha/beta hydrolase
MSIRWPVEASDGHKFDLLVEAPPDPHGVLLFMCALGVEASYYEPFAKALSRKGIMAAICDLRGNGTSSLRPRREVDFGYREIVEHDIPAAVKVVVEESPGIPLLLGGHSLGGQLAMLHVAATRPPIEAMVLVACAIPYYRNWSGKSRAFIQLLSRVFPVLGSLLGYVPGHRFGFGGIEARTLMRDWSHNARTARYEPIGSTFDYEAALADIEIDLVTVNVDGDAMAPPNAVDFLLDKVPGAKGVRIEAKLSAPKPGPSAHMRWARDPDDVVRAISDWLATHRAGC